MSQKLKRRLCSSNVVNSKYSLTLNLNSNAIEKIMQILQLDITGHPQNYITPEEASLYYATDSVSWTVGDICASLRGGMNAQSGLQSRIDIHPIIAVRGAAKFNMFDAVPSLSNSKLFARDGYICVYCGSHHGPHGLGLTREHIIPTSRGGRDIWENTASACRNCNGRKAAKTLDEANMKLLYRPFVPSVFEDFLLRGRNIHGDVREWLLSRVSKNFRLKA